MRNPFGHTGLRNKIRVFSSSRSKSQQRPLRRHCMLRQRRETGAGSLTTEYIPSASSRLKMGDAWGKRAAIAKRTQIIVDSKRGQSLVVTGPPTLGLTNIQPPHYTSDPRRPALRAMINKSMNHILYFGLIAGVALA